MCQILSLIKISGYLGKVALLQEFVHKFTGFIYAVYHLSCVEAILFTSRHIHAGVKLGLGFWRAALYVF